MLLSVKIVQIVKFKSFSFIDYNYCLKSRGVVWNQSGLELIIAVR